MNLKFQRPQSAGRTKKKCKSFFFMHTQMSELMNDPPSGELAIGFPKNYTQSQNQG